MAKGYNKIRKLDNVVSDDKKSYKPLFIILSFGVIFTIILLIIFKDTFKLNSIDTFDESSKILYNKKLENIYESITINSEFANIYLNTSNDDYIEVKIYGESAKEKVTAKDKKLDINLKLTCTVCHDVKGGKIYVTLPNSLLKNLDINSKFGSVSIAEFNDTIINTTMEYGDFDAAGVKKLNLKLKSGNVKLSHAESVTSSIETGNLTVNNIYGYCDIDTGLGNVIVTYLDVNKDSKINVKTGSVNLVEANELYYDAKSNVGQIHLPVDNVLNKNKTKVSITTDVGNISVGS